MDKLNHLCSTNTPMQPENSANNKESLSSSLSSCSSSSSSSSSLSYSKKHKLNRSDSTKPKQHNKESISPNNFSKQASPSFDFNNNSSSNFAKNDTNNNYSNYNNNLAQRLNLLESTSFNPVQFLADTNLLDFQKTVPFLNANFFLDQTLSSNNNNNNNSPNQNNSINTNNDTASFYLQSLKANLMPQPNDTKSLELQMALATAAALSSNFLPTAQANSDLDKAN